MLSDGRRGPDIPDAIGQAGIDKAQERRLLMQCILMRFASVSGDCWFRFSLMLWWPLACELPFR